MRSQYTVFLVLGLLLIVPYSGMIPIDYDVEAKGVQASNARATSTWSGNVWLNSSYHVSSSDALIVDECTQIWMAAGIRIYIDGRLTVEGTESCPVNIHSQGFGDHQGIQFNSSSRNRGSIIDNLSVEDSEYAFTVYNSNPVMNNVSIEDADRVAIDLYNSASPIIRDLNIQDGGQGFADAFEWRQGIGLSVGNYSTPIVEGFTADGLENRAMNVWGNSGGMYRNLNFTDIGGAVLSLSAAIWIEDSQLLIEDAYIDECDNGVYIRHITDSSITRAVMRRVVIEDSQFRGMMIDKSDHMNYTNYQSAVIEDLEIRGTGGIGAAAQNWAEAALEINASGAWIENALIEDNIAPGIRLFFADSATTLNNVSIQNSGNANKGPHAAGIYNTAAFFAPTMNNLSIEGSAGPGIWAEAGGAIQGSNWMLANNSAQGMWIDGSAIVVDGMHIHDNNLSGLRVNDGRKVELSNVSSSGNGHQGTGPENGAGMVFIESNDVESNSGDVICRNCTSRNEAWGGVWAKDSVDLWLDNFEIYDPQNGTPAIAIDNSGLTSSFQGGHFNILGVNVWVNRTGPAIDIIEAAGVIDGLDMNGNHLGLHWEGDDSGSWISELSHTTLRGSDCLRLRNHSSITSIALNISVDCTGTVELENVHANWSTTFDESGMHIISLDADSSLRLHQPENIDMNLAVIPSGAYIDLAWDITIWVINQYGNGVPRADVEVSFDQFSSDYNYVSDWLGFDKFPNYIGQRWDDSGASSFTQVSIECTYDNTTNTTTFSFEDDGILYCVLDLANQPPFLIWSTPEDQDIFASGANIEFNASESWDLDNDTVTFSWTSSLDGEFGTSSLFSVNSGTGISLSDGVHDITLQICDDKGNCISETRTIELTNLPPIVSVITSPSPDSDNVIRMAWTSELTINASSTMDPEGDSLSRRTWASYWPSSQICASDCPDEWNLSFADSQQANLTLELGFSDGINAESVWSIKIELFNEIPIPKLEVVRQANTSDQLVVLDSSNTIDPEGDRIGIRWISDIDGELGMSDVNASLLTWQGYLSRGRHEIIVQVWDDHLGRLGAVNEMVEVVIVENSAPVVVIEAPESGLVIDTSTIVNFSTEGSGDWDSWCDDYPIGYWICSDTANPSGSDLLSIDWISNISGPLTPPGVDWLIWSGRLPAGDHNITVTFDDLLGGVSTAYFSIKVNPSAPILGLVSPQDGKGFESKEDIIIDATNSIDFDDDAFTMTLFSNHPLVDGPLLEEVEADKIHTISLPSGTHELTFWLRDDSGMERNETITVIVSDSAPVAVVDSPEIVPGVSKTLSPTEKVFFSANSSSDADGDISKYEWFRYTENETWEIILSQSYGDVELASGNHHIKLIVSDTRGKSDELHFNLTLRESWPELSNLTLSQEKFKAGTKSTLNIQFEMFDADGSTEVVQADLIYGAQDQNWMFELVEQDGVWKGELTFIPAGSGWMQLQIKAIDGSVVREMTIDLEVEAELEEVNWAQIGGGVGGGVLLIIVLLFLVGRRRKKLSEIGLVESWSSFDKAMQVRNDTSELDQANLFEQEEDGDMPKMIDL